MTVKHDNQEINISFPEWIINDENKLRKCLEILDKYAEINEIGKNGIMKNHVELFDNTVVNESNIQALVEKLAYPDISFSIVTLDDSDDDDKETEPDIYFRAYYAIPIDHSEIWSEFYLGITMNQKLEITGWGVTRK